MAVKWKKKWRIARTISKGLISGIFCSEILGLINNIVFVHDSNNDNNAEIKNTMDCIES